MSASEREGSRAPATRARVVAARVPAGRVLWRVAGILVGAIVAAVLWREYGGTAAAVMARSASVQQASALAGVTDVHVHASPDSRPRSIDALELARLARARGMRALVLKNHYEPTGGLAYIARKEVPGIEVFGGVALNLTVGGINAAAVEHMTRMEGGWGRIVWMPTFDAEHQVRRSNEDRPFVSVSRDGRLPPEVQQVIGLIAQHRLVLATGHSSPDEVLLLLREARQQGVQRMIVTHAMFSPVLMTIEQMKQAAAEGAFIEFPAGPPTAEDVVPRADRVAGAIREIGPRHVILSSDLGQSGAPLPPDGFAEFIAALHERGISESALALMTRQNPALLLGLPLNSELPGPYETVRDWGKLPNGREWGPTGAIRVDNDGRSIWVIDRCGTGSCTTSDLPPVIKLDAAGNVVQSFGAGLFIFPHGLHIDRDGNVWVTDARGAPPDEAGRGRGHRVIKFSPSGDVLLTLGGGPAGDPPNRLTEPNAVVTAANGDIFVAESHSGRSAGRISKYAPDGTFIMSWGSIGSGRSEFLVAHDLAMDSQGRLFVADRSNYRIQIFDQDGQYLDEWKQFGQPSGIHITPDDMLYVTDSHSFGDDERGDGENWRKGIRVGSARTGLVSYFLPDLEATTRANSGAEGITADAAGNIYGAIVRRGGIERHHRVR